MKKWLIVVGWVLAAASVAAQPCPRPKFPRPGGKYYAQWYLMPEAHTVLAYGGAIGEGRSWRAGFMAGGNVGMQLAWPWAAQIGVAVKRESQGSRVVADGMNWNYVGWFAEIPLEVRYQFARPLKDFKRTNYLLMGLAPVVGAPLRGLPPEVRATGGTSLPFTNARFYDLQGQLALGFSRKLNKSYQLHCETVFKFSPYFSRSPLYYHDVFTGFKMSVMKRW